MTKESAQEYVPVNRLAMSVINNNNHVDMFLQNESGEPQCHDPVRRIINPRSYDDLLMVADAIRSQLGSKADVEIGIICGSGLGPIGDQVEDPTVLPYEKIPGFPSVKVVGHKGNLIFGHIAGRKVVCMQGRFHPYEHNMDLALCAFPVRVMHQLGIKRLVVSNAAGGVNPKFKYGDLMLIKDHIFLPGLAGFSPLVGLNDSRFGARFVSVHDAYDKSLRKLAMDIARRQGMQLYEGIYVMCGGPQYESPAEVLMFKTVGADALGMSTCHEVTVAKQCGIKVLGFSLITNIANTDADSAVNVSHEEVLHTAKEAGDRASKFVKDIIRHLPKESL
ncbi:Purine nucleoside phosphorylase I inosine and guanosine-specific [Trichostrongylus colubriformis]|uniref:Purine nucleoside phosphorylase n=1 Tax=Trichostrongylus colubriformis TaxID=6319 RepID=A0AAN8G2Q8_TRICO